MYVIKRYPNRKLYDTEKKRYITLNGIAALIRRGVDIQVIDHETGKDLTTVTLSQIILEQEKLRVGMLPKTILTSLIRTGGDTLDILKRSFYTSVGAAQLLQDEIEKRIEILVKKGEMAEDEAQRLRHELLKLHEPPGEYEGDNREGGPFDAALERLNLPSRTDVHRLSSQLEDLTLKLDALLKRGERAPEE
jgi:polyhydroxyalkanoate synthesis repressor PhaR